MHAVLYYKHMKIYVYDKFSNLTTIVGHTNKDATGYNVRPGVSAQQHFVGCNKIVYYPNVAFSAESAAKCR